MGQIGDTFFFVPRSQQMVISRLSIKLLFRFDQMSNVHYCQSLLSHKNLCFFARKFSLELDKTLITYSRAKFILTVNLLVDIDECSLDSDKCYANSECTNTEGSYSCTCKPGYSGDGHNCTGYFLGKYALI